MEAAVEQKSERLGGLQAPMQHDHDLVHELSNRLSTLWHYGECLANAEGDPEAQKVWRDLQRHEQAAIRELKMVIARRIEQGEFLEDL
jgi:hypothetical protein